MRTLSFALLFIVGGIVAALPFRRYQVIEDASHQPTQATGPTQSALGNIELEMMVKAATQDMNVNSLALKPQPRWPLPGEVARPLTQPRSYDEVAVPIDLSADKQAFSAAVRDPHNSSPAPPRRPHDPAADIVETQAIRIGDNHRVEPLMESFAITTAPQRSQENRWNEPESILVDDGQERSASVIAQPSHNNVRHHPTATAVLASSPQGETTTNSNAIQTIDQRIDERLPANSTPQRKHYWIRQPD